MTVLTRTGWCINYWRKFIINGCANKFVTAIIIISWPILTSPSRLVAYKRLVSAGEANVSVSVSGVKASVLVSGFNISCPSLTADEIPTGAYMQIN